MDASSDNNDATPKSTDSATHSVAPRRFKRRHVVLVGAVLAAAAALTTVQYVDEEQTQQEAEKLARDLADVIEYGEPCDCFMRDAVSFDETVKAAERAGVHGVSNTPPSSIHDATKFNYAVVDAARRARAGDRKHQLYRGAVRLEPDRVDVKLRNGTTGRGWNVVVDPAPGWKVMNNPSRPADAGSITFVVARDPAGVLKIATPIQDIYGTDYGAQTKVGAPAFQAPTHRQIRRRPQ